MIPKVIHYCWFGRNPKPKLAEKCIASWKKYCPDYEIFEWNEDNFDVNQNPYTRMCYEEKKYAFLTDYIRLLVVYQHGGIYFDTDVEVVQSFNDLLLSPAFFGFEGQKFVNTGVGFGASAGDETVKKMIDEYDVLLDGQHGVIGCPTLNTQALLKLGLTLNGRKQTLTTGAEVYPADYFNPYNDETGELEKTKNTHSIHWFAKSWLDKKSIIRSKITQPFHRIFGVNCFAWLKKGK